MIKVKRPRQVQDVINQAIEVLGQPSCPEAEVREMHTQLLAVLGETDPFWARWLAYTDDARGLKLL